MNPQGTHNLQVLRGLVSARSLLSCTPDGKVDLWQVDDGSGRQVWNVSPVDDFPGVFNITLSSGTNPGKQFLSCTRDGATVDLYDHDDGSGRQRWRFVAVAGARICNYANVQVVGGVDGGRVFLSCTPEGDKVDLWNVDDGSGRQRWQVQ